MNLKELLKEIEKSNKISDKIGLPYKYYLVVSDNCSRHILYSKKDINKINSYYIQDVADKLLNDKLIKEEGLFYSIDISIENLTTIIENFEIRIGVES